MRWMKLTWLYFLLSALVIIPGTISLLLFGLKPSIDFTGGTLLEYKFTNGRPQNYPEIEDLLAQKGFFVSSIQSSAADSVLLRMKPISMEESETIKKAIEEKYGQAPQETRFETVGPTLGKELLRKTILAVVLAAGFILAYVGWSFKNLKFGICAILAMFHDSLILLGSFSLLGHFLGVEVDTLFVTAVLTILSFSVHDTVVVYDRIRESQRLYPDASFIDLANKAVTETLSRSLNNSLTIIFMLIALLLLGGVTTRWFVAALLIGTVTGTYSSTFTATPLLVVWTKIEEKRKSRVRS